MKKVDEKQFIQCLRKKYPNIDKDLVDAFMDVFFHLLKKEISIQYKDFPLIKAKLSKSTMNIDSPKTRRKDCINVRIKLDK